MPKKRRQDRDGLHQRPNSPYWWASYIDAGGKRTRRSTGTSDRAEAEALLAKWKLEAHKGRQWGEQPTRTFDELMLTYLAGPSATKRSHDRDTYSMKRLYPVFTGRELHTLTPADLHRYIKGRREDGVGTGTINREIGLLSAALNFARHELGWDIPNPAQGRRQKEREGRLRWISRAEAQRLIAAALQEPQAPYLADFIQLALNTGCRRNELLGLEWTRVDLKRNLLFLEACHTKAGKRRSIPLNATARAALLSRARYRATHCPASAWVFATKDGMRVASIKRSWATACRRSGIADFRIHDLRHTCAAWLVTAGVPLTEIRDLLGHSTIRMTERYAHLAPDNIRVAVDRLEDEPCALDVLMSVPSSPAGHKA